MVELDFSEKEVPVSLGNLRLAFFGNQRSLGVILTYGGISRVKKIFEELTSG